MHKPLLVRLSNGASPGHLADLGEALGNADPPINISAVGGAEWQGHGTVSILIDGDHDQGTIERFTAIAEDLRFEVRQIESVTIELDNVPGELGRAARKLADASVNIESVLVVGIRAGHAIVSIGVDASQLDAARAALGQFLLLGDAPLAQG